jgi:hypothetical protein
MFLLNFSRNIGLIHSVRMDYIYVYIHVCVCVLEFISLCKFTVALLICCCQFYANKQFGQTQLHRLSSGHNYLSDILVVFNENNFHQ